MEKCSKGHISYPHEHDVQEGYEKKSYCIFLDLFKMELEINSRHFLLKP